MFFVWVSLSGQSLLVFITHFSRSFRSTAAVPLGSVSYVHSAVGFSLPQLTVSCQLPALAADRRAPAAGRGSRCSCITAGEILAVIQHRNTAGVNAQ